jgi:hypothetical protein
MERPRKQNEDGVKSLKIEDKIGNVGRDRGISMTGSRTVKANGKSLRSLDVAGGTSGEGKSSPGGNTGEKRGRHADHLMPQFLIVI